MAKPTPAAPALPDFVLAEVRGFDPTALDTKLPLVRFVLSLAGAFNDLKGALYVAARLGETGRIAQKDPAWMGQHAGMVIQTIRFLAGILHELMNVIGEHTDVVDSSEFRELVAHLDSPYRRAWSQVARIARREDRVPDTSHPSADSRFLLLIRNKVAFHYDAKVIAKGYADFFADPTQKYKDKALISDGRMMEETRFYFADGAMQQGLISLSGLPLLELQRRLNAISQDVNFALKFIVMGYIRKVATPSRYVPRT